MKLTRQIAAIFLIGVMIIGLSVPVFAHEGEHTPGEKDDLLDSVQDVSESVEGETKRATKVVGSATERLKLQRKRIEEKKAELKEAIQTPKAEAKRKLEGRRMAICENREERINKLIAKSAETGRSKLSVIQKIEEGVKSFYEQKNISADEYDETVSKVDESEADAIAALNVLETTSFKCKDVTNNAPGQAVKAVIAERNSALKTYRTSVVHLIQVVKQSLPSTKTPGGES